MELVKAGREDRVKYQSRTAIKQKKVSVLFSCSYTEQRVITPYDVCFIDDCVKRKCRWEDQAINRRSTTRNCLLLPQDQRLVDQSE